MKPTTGRSEPGSGGGKRHKQDQPERKLFNETNRLCGRKKRIVFRQNFELQKGQVRLFSVICRGKIKPEDVAERGTTERT
jgi:hypothetical protein